MANPVALQWGSKFKGIRGVLASLLQSRLSRMSSMHSLTWQGSRSAQNQGGEKGSLKLQLGDNSCFCHCRQRKACNLRSSGEERSSSGACSRGVPPKGVVVRLRSVELWMETFVVCKTLSLHTLKIACCLILFYSSESLLSGQPRGLRCVEAEEECST